MSLLDVAPSEALVRAVIDVESAGNPRAVNPRTGASGLMQIMPETAAQPGFSVQPMRWDQRFDKAENQRFGTDYLGAMLSRYNGDLDRSLAAYNWGPGNADRWDGDPQSLPRETRGYIRQVRERLSASVEVAQNDQQRSDVAPAVPAFDPEKLKAAKEALRQRQQQPRQAAQPASGGFDPEKLKAAKEALRRPTRAQTPVPEGMVLDPETGQMRDTKAVAELRSRDPNRGVLDRVGDAVSVMGRATPFIGSYADEAARALGADEVDIQQRLANADQFEADNPNTAMGLKLAQGVMTAAPVVAAGAPAATLGPGLTGRVVGNAAFGGLAGLTEGAVYGAGEGEGEERIDNAVQGGVVGGVAGAGLGVAAPAAGAVGRAVVGAVGSRMARNTAAEAGTSREAAGVVGEMLEADGGAGRVSDTGMLADAGPATAGLLDTAMQSAGPAGQRARRAIDGRANAAAGQLNEALDQSVAQIAPVPKSARLNQVYDTAYAKPIDYSSAVGRKIEGLLPRVPASAIETANRLMRAEGVQSRQIMAEIAEDGSATFTQMPDVRQLDYITRALSDIAKRGDGKGVMGGNTNEGRILKGLTREIRGAMREAVPAYGRALDAAATEIGQREARELGRSALSRGVSREQLADEVAGMSTVEMRRLREGVRGYIDDLMAGTRRTMTDGNTEAREAVAGLKALSSREVRDKLRTVLGEADGDKLFARLDTVAEAFDLRASVATNSRTYGRQTVRRVVDAATEPGFVGQLMSGSPVKSVQRLAQMMARLTPEDRLRVEQRVMGEIADLLTRQGPEARQTAEILQRSLQRQPGMEQLADQVAETLSGAVASGGYPALLQTTGMR